MRSRTTVLLSLAGAALAAVALVPGSVAVASGSRHGGSGHGQNLAPVVRHTGTAPTGYEVTFRFQDPTAKRVQIKGEWYFANVHDVSAPTGTETDPVVTPADPPSAWKPGDFPIQSPNSTAANWPVTAMTENRRTGVWSFTTPLPSGVFSYGFYVDCTTADQSGCTEVPDPSNLPWNDVHGTPVGSAQTVSQVYVPSDPRFGTTDESWLAPNPVHGTLKHVTYPSPTSTDPVGQNYLSVYTPPHYDAHRSTPYPTLYLSHGGGGNELDWSTQGDLSNIMDNLIDTGQIQPMVVIMTNAYTYPDVTEYHDYDANLVSVVIPWVQTHYDVSTQASERAMGGLSMGGAITNSLLFNDTQTFGYYGVMSPGYQGTPPFGNGHYNVPAASQISADKRAQLSKVGIYVGGGWQDVIHWYAASEVSTLTQAGQSVTPDFVNGGHEWSVWRVTLRDFLTHVAFQPPVGG